MKIIILHAEKDVIFDKIVKVVFYMVVLFCYLYPIKLHIEQKELQPKQFTVNVNVEIVQLQYWNVPSLLH